ncbi:hypothetical protein EDD16DRAFT_1484954, partial [Pisolithus croceorrhizus]
EVAVAKPTHRSKKQSKEYKIKNVLRAPRTTQYTTKSLYGMYSMPRVLPQRSSICHVDQIIDNSVDLDPEYQRGNHVIWFDEKQSGLIDSILRNYYMPPIIFGMLYLFCAHMVTDQPPCSRLFSRRRERTPHQAVGCGS